MAAFFKSIYGRQLGLGHAGQMVAHDIDITAPCVDATVTVGDESANVRAITIQLKDANGNDIDYAETVIVHVFLDAAGLNWAATGGSTGIEIGTDGDLETLVTKKVFIARSEADGDLDLTWTDTGTEAAFIGVQLPSGRVVFGSQALTNA